MLAASAGWALSADSSAPAIAAQTNAKPSNPDLVPPPNHDRRMHWWREAKFGMFIHWGLYSILGRGEWAMVIEDIPVGEYQQLAQQFHPPTGAPRAWAKLARQAGMKYMVMTTKHHDGFCLFASKETTYNAALQGPGRDLVTEYAEAVRAEGLRVGFYFSLMDWHDPDWWRCKTDPEARSRFVTRVHSEIRQLMTGYGKIDEFWYDGAFPLDAEGWRSHELNAMILELQPEIVINNRNWLAGDFSTPEQSLDAAKGDWESCMTLNEHWGYGAADNNWKPAKTLAHNLAQCSMTGGNYLLNIGPRADGSVPEPCVRILHAVGDWVAQNGAAIHGIQKADVSISDGFYFSRKGSTLLLYLMDWPVGPLTVGGIHETPTAARYLASGKPLQFEMRGTRLVFPDLPATPPDPTLTVLAVDFATAPVQDSAATRIVDAAKIQIHDEVAKGWG
jgi:alpha-L-fucosidase